MPSNSKKLDEILELLSSMELKEPKKINECTSKKQLYKFTVSELVQWLKKNRVSIKNTTNKHKKDWVNKVWEYLDDDSEEESSSDSDSSDSDDSSSDDE
jgi:hypothetical protein